MVKVLNGRTEGNKPIEIINVQHPMSNKNKFALVKITKANIWSLKGKIIVILGRQRAGKRVGDKIAKKINGEIVSADSGRCITGYWQWKNN